MVEHRWMRYSNGLTGDIDLPYSFHEAKDADGRICYISHFFNVVVTDVEPYRQLELLRGGRLPT